MPTNLAELELAVLAAEWEHDLTRGLIPHWAARPMFPHERASGLNALAADDEIRRFAQKLISLLIGTRRRWSEVLGRDLAGRATAEDAVQRLVRVESNLSVIAADLIRETTNEAEALLRGAVTTGAERLIGEAISQKVLAPESIEPAIRDLNGWVRMEADRVTRAPLGEVTAKARQAVTHAAPGTPTDVAHVVETVIDEASVATLESDFGRVPAQQSWGRGRSGAVGLFGQQPAVAYASELLDKRTCDKCTDIDGTEFLTLQEARFWYPTSTFKDCRGGPSCRGMVVYVWNETDPADQ